MAACYAAKREREREYEREGRSANLMTICDAQRPLKVDESWNYPKDALYALIR